MLIIELLIKAVNGSVALLAQSNNIIIFIDTSRNNAVSMRSSGF